MNELTFFIFLQSIFIGLTLAAPVGPIGVLTIRRTLAYGRWTGFVSGLGTATADAVYGFIGTLGESFWIPNHWLSEFLEQAWQFI